MRRFALPALLPLIGPDLNLTDSEGALLTVGYTVRSLACPLSFCKCKEAKGRWVTYCRLSYFANKSLHQVLRASLAEWEQVPVCLPDAGAVRNSAHTGWLSGGQDGPAAHAGRRPRAVEPAHHGSIQGNAPLPFPLCHAIQGLPARFRKTHSARSSLA